MNLFLCALRPGSGTIQKSELFAYLARLPRDVQFESIIEGPFAGVVASGPATMRSMIARHRQLIGVGDVRLDNRSEVLKWARGGDGLSDLQLVLAALDVCGSDVVQRLLGDFAFVVWDARAQKIIAARDAFGVKPLFYRRRSDIVLFASRAAPLAAGEEYDTAYMQDFMFGAPGHGPATVWQDVKRFDPATVMVQRGTGFTLQRYWSPDQFTAARDGDEAQSTARFRELLVSAIATRLDPSVTWAQLSGGLDSSSVVASAESLIAPGSITSTVTLTDSLGEGDERPFRDCVLRQYNLSNHQVDDVWPWQAAESALAQTDEPHPLYPFRARDQRMRSAVVDRGGRVLLSGLGADHYLYGNLSYIPDLVMAGQLMKAARELVGWSLVNRQSFWTMSRRHVLKPLLRSSLLDRPEPDAMRFPAWLGDGRAYAQRFDRIYDFMTRPPRGGMFAYYTKRELEGVPAWVSRDGFEDGMEMRYPFLSRPLVEFALTLPVHMRVRPFARKWILREAMRGVLPEPVRTRQSKGCIDARIIWAFQQEHATLKGLLKNPILADLGLIDAHALRSAVEEARCGVKHNLVMLMSTLSLETWLAVRDGRMAAVRKAA